MISSCLECGLKYNCICDHIPLIEINAHIALLMHENEQGRETNTGQWLLKSTKSASQHIWKRKQPCSKLAALISDPSYQAFVLFPGQQSQLINKAIHNGGQIKNTTLLFIILDGTWQEANKMLRKSPWLQDIPKVSLDADIASSYHLRRNQKFGNLCTLEVGAEIIRCLGYAESAVQLHQFLIHYSKAFYADKSGHQLK
ncbi:DTW domain-containing protein [Vibrio pectenicida]|uniref:tRNA-uridine aminocarboxypropyltransferase n=1 Tax=Vibrio pectenicida TaxID=62763 RepID=A0A7Y3ZZY6_9VIBR|nr:DTW domain-containing protein [Vibrio pectenicida]NOH72191.1 DTW domain-containing protein [Vibrio pectenicida]